MTIDELKAKHFWNVQLANKYSYLLREDKTYLTNNHTHLSVQFTIEVLKELDVTILKLFKNTLEYDLINDEIYDKIQELKEYLNEEV